jgi:hypothetical protein
LRVEIQDPPIVDRPVRDQHFIGWRLALRNLDNAVPVSDEGVTVRQNGAGAGHAWCLDPSRLNHQTSRCS